MRSFSFVQNSGRIKVKVRLHELFGLWQRDVQVLHGLHLDRQILGA